MSKRFSITTAIAYVNGSPHMGHALEFVEADAIARYHRLLGEEVYYLTGTDEHGTKIVQTAEKLGIPVQEMVDQNAEKFKDLMKQYRISHDQFIRTSDQKKHWPAVQKLWKKMEANGDIYAGEYKGLYCVGCEEFKIEKDLVDGKCPNHPNRPLQELEQKNYFFRLSKYSEQIANILKSGQVKIVPSFRANEIISLCESGLEDVSFSRPKEQLSWGIPVPGDDSQVMYVWCDALANYISALDYENEGELFKKFWPVDCHVIGKDILRFHAGVWIGMLLSAEIELPKTELVHGWIHYQGGRMSKSVGNVVDPVELANHYGVDAARYYLLAEIPVGQDGDFSYQLFENKINADLSNNLGNFVNRVLSMVDRYAGGKVPQKKLDVPSEIEDFWEEYHAAFAEYDHQRAGLAMIRLVDFGNRYIAEKMPWELAKDETKQGELEEVLRMMLKMLLHVTFMLSPFCPDKAQEIAASFDLDDQIDFTELKKLQQNTLLDEVKSVRKPEKLLFDRIEEERSLIARDQKTVTLPKIPLPVSEGVQELKLPVVAFTMTGLKPIGTGVQKRLKKEWEKWIEDLKKRPAAEKKNVDQIIEKAYALNESLGVGRDETPGNALLQQFLADPNKEFPFINPLVAFYNYVEAKSGLSIGAHDLSLLKGDVELKICDGSEEYWPIGADKAKKVPAGTYAYCDDEGKRVICWLEVKQSRDTAVSNKTTDVLFILQGYEGVDLSYVQAAADELKLLVEQWLK
jgi:methionyl-tRNA synthetase